MPNDLLERTMQSLTAGAVGFDMTCWFDYLHPSPQLNHSLPEVELQPECETVGCLAAHIAMSAGYSPDPGLPHVYCKIHDRPRKLWADAALKAWKAEYPDGDVHRLEEVFTTGNHLVPDSVTWDPTLDQLERALKSCTGEHDAS